MFTSNSQYAAMSKTPGSKNSGFLRNFAHLVDDDAEWMPEYGMTDTFEDWMTQNPLSA